MRKKIMAKPEVLMHRCLRFELGVLRMKYGDRVVAKERIKAKAEELGVDKKEAVRILHDDYVSQLIGSTSPISPLIDEEDADQVRAFRERQQHA